MEEVVLTSATLTVEGDFGYIKEQLGLDLLPEHGCQAIYESPFDFSANVLVLMAQDLPNPDSIPSI